MMKLAALFQLLALALATKRDSNNERPATTVSSMQDSAEDVTPQETYHSQRQFIPIRSPASPTGLHPSEYRHVIPAVAISQRFSPSMERPERVRPEAAAGRRTRFMIRDLLEHEDTATQRSPNPPSELPNTDLHPTFQSPKQSMEYQSELPRLVRPIPLRIKLPYLRPEVSGRPFGFTVPHMLGYENTGTQPSPNQPSDIPYGSLHPMFQSPKQSIEYQSELPRLLGPIPILPKPPYPPPQASAGRFPAFLMSDIRTRENTVIQPSPTPPSELPYGYLHQSSHIDAMRPGVSSRPHTTIQGPSKILDGSTDQISYSTPTSYRQPTDAYIENSPSTRSYDGMDMRSDSSNKRRASPLHQPSRIPSGPGIGDGVAVSASDDTIRGAKKKKLDPVMQQSDSGSRLLSSEGKCDRAGQKADASTSQTDQDGGKKQLTGSSDPRSLPHPSRIPHGPAVAVSPSDNTMSVAKKRRKSSMPKRRSGLSSYESLYFHYVGSRPRFSKAKSDRASQKTDASTIRTDQAGDKKQLTGSSDSPRPCTSSTLTSSTMRDYGKKIKCCPYCNTSTSLRGLADHLMDCDKKSSQNVNLVPILRNTFQGVPPAADRPIGVSKPFVNVQLPTRTVAVASSTVADSAARDSSSTAVSPSRRQKPLSKLSATVQQSSSGTDKVAASSVKGSGNSSGSVNTLAKRSTDEDPEKERLIARFLNRFQALLSRSTATSGIRQSATMSTSQRNSMMDSLRRRFLPSSSTATSGIGQSATMSTSQGEMAAESSNSSRDSFKRRREGGGRELSPKRVRSRTASPVARRSRSRPPSGDHSE